MARDNFVDYNNMQDILNGIEQKISGLGSQLTGIYNWATNTQYRIGDVVIENGSLFICQTVHTSSTSFASDIANWILFYADISPWMPNTYYVANACVINDKKLYQCKTAHTSGTTFSNADWNLIAGGGGSSISVWTTSKQYNADDIVIYSNSLYRCNTTHTSSTFSTDASNWDLVYADLKNWNNNVYYSSGVTVIYNSKIYVCNTAHTSASTFSATEKANWTPLCTTSIKNWQASTYYDVDDIVIYNGSLFRCTTANTSSTFVASNFSLITADLKSWSASTSYVVGAIVINSNKLYRCKTAHTSGTTFSATDWDLIGSSSIDDWASSTSYVVDDIVIYNNNLYRCTTAHTSSSTFDNSKWQILGMTITSPIKVGEVGFVSWQYTLMQNHIALDGGTVSNFKSNYSDLYDFFDNNSVLTTVLATYNADKSLCYYDSSTDTATLPNFLDKTVWGGSTIVEKKAGLPNIIGHLGMNGPSTATWWSDKGKSGALGAELRGPDNYVLASNASSNGNFDTITFNASKSNSIYGNSTTVQPPAIQLIPQIRYAKDTVDGSVEEYGNSPIGTIISYMGNTAPEEYLVCDGTAYSINDYWELAEFIKSEFGSYNYFGGDGTSTFAVPDLRGEFLRGTGTNSHTNQGNGGNVGIHQDATEFPNYGISSGSYIFSQSIPSSGDNNVVKTDSSYNKNGSGTGKSGSLSNSSWTFTTNNMFTARPTNTSVLYCIKYTNSLTMQPDSVYSTSEKRIGTWIDGKPLYQKTFTGYTIATGSGGTILNMYDISTLGIDKVISLDACVHQGNESYFGEWTELSTDYISYGVNSSNTYIRCKHSGFGGYDVRVTIRYTKT